VISQDSITIDIPDHVVPHGAFFSITLEEEQDVRDWHDAMKERSFDVNLWESTVSGRTTVTCSYVESGVRVDVRARREDES
jgi:hypothetical protein